MSKQPNYRMGWVVESVTRFRRTGEWVGRKENERFRGRRERNRDQIRQTAKTREGTPGSSNNSSSISVMRLFCNAWEPAMRPACCHTRWTNTSCFYVALSCHAVEQGITASCCHTKAPQCYAVIRGTMATASPGMQLLDTEWFVETADWLNTPSSL